MRTIIYLLAGLASLAALEPRDAEQDASQALEEAETLARKGRYDQAHRAYAKLAEQYPSTEAGRVAQRRSQPSAYLGWDFLVENGPSENRIDIVVMGDGFQLGEQNAFDDIAGDLPREFERDGVFREYYSYLNFVRANLASADNGVDGFGREYDTALNGHTIGTIQGHVAVDTELVYERLDELPQHDRLAVVFVKLGVLGTGGGGVATIGGRDPRTVIHEFGHALAGLGDEYASQTHSRSGNPRRQNVSDTEDPELLPWKHWIEAGARGVGAYEGANGQVRDAWKPTSGGCVMESGQQWCVVCREALVLSIYERVDPIDSASPEPQSVTDSSSLSSPDKLSFEVITQRPKSHPIEVSFWVLPENKAPRGGGSAALPADSDSRYGRGSGRRARGRLSEIDEQPADVSKDKKGVHRFTLNTRQLEPGRYRVIARAVDTTELRGDRLPWVIRDEDHLLRSERGWWVEVPERE